MSHDVSMLLLTALFATGVLAGAMNAVAGGGSFVTFPVMVFIGLPPVTANASSTIALFPGGLSSIWAYRDDLRRVFIGVPLWALGAASAIGGGFGAVLLLSTPQSVFDAVIPWVLLAATLTFTFGRRVGERFEERLTAGPAALLAIQLGLGVYGGYFGGAVGIMMMAAWTVVSRADVKSMTQHRSVLVNAANAVAVLLFMTSDKVAWPATLAMLAGAVLGGYWGRARDQPARPARHPRLRHRAEHGRNPGVFRPAALTRLRRPRNCAGCPARSRTPASAGPWSCRCVHARHPSGNVWG